AAQFRWRIWIYGYPLALLDLFALDCSGANPALARFICGDEIATGIPRSVVGVGNLLAAGISCVRAVQFDLCAAAGALHFSRDWANRGLDSAWRSASCTG